MRDFRKDSIPVSEFFDEVARASEIHDHIAFLVKDNTKEEPYITNGLTLTCEDDVAEVECIYCENGDDVLIVVKGSDEPLYALDLELSDLETILHYLESDLPYWDKE